MKHNLLQHSNGTLEQFTLRHRPVSSTLTSEEMIKLLDHMHCGKGALQNPTTNRYSSLAGRACSSDEEADVMMIWALTFGMQTGQRPSELLSVKYVWDMLFTLFVCSLVSLHSLCLAHSDVVQAVAAVFFAHG